MLATTAMEVAKEFSWMMLKSPPMTRNPYSSHAAVGWQRTLATENWKEKFIQERGLPTLQVGTFKKWLVLIFHQECSSVLVHVS